MWLLTANKAPVPTARREGAGGAAEIALAPIFLEQLRRLAGVHPRMTSLQGNFDDIDKETA